MNKKEYTISLEISSFLFYFLHFFIIKHKVGLKVTHQQLCA